MPEVKVVACFPCTQALENFVSSKSSSLLLSFPARVWPASVLVGFRMLHLRVLYRVPGAEMFTTTKYNLKTLKSPEIMNSTEMSQSIGGGQRAEVAGVGTPSLHRLYSGMFSLAGFYSSLWTWVVEGAWLWSPHEGRVEGRVVGCVCVRALSDRVHTEEARKGGRKIRGEGKRSVWPGPKERCRCGTSTTSK